MSHIQMQLVLTNKEGKTVSFPLDSGSVNLHTFLLCGTTLTPDPDAILRSSKTAQGAPILTLGKEPINDEKAVYLAEAARQIIHNPVWGVITSTVIEHAREKTIQFAEKPEDTIVYKAMQSLVEYQTNLLGELARFIHRKNSSTKNKKEAK